MTQQQEAVFGCKPASHSASEQSVISVCVQTRSFLAHCDETAAGPHATSASAVGLSRYAHVAPSSHPLSSQALRVDLPWRSFPSQQPRIPRPPLPHLTACLAPLYVSLQTSATGSGDQRFGKPLGRGWDCSLLYIVCSYTLSWCDDLRFPSALLCHPQTLPQAGLAMSFGTRWQWDWEQTGCAGVGCSVMIPLLPWTHCVRH